MELKDVIEKSFKRNGTIDFSLLFEELSKIFKSSPSQLEDGRYLTSKDFCTTTAILGLSTLNTFIRYNPSFKNECTVTQYSKTFINVENAIKHFMQCDSDKLRGKAQRYGKSRKGEPLSYGA